MKENETVRPSGAQDDASTDPQAAPDVSASPAQPETVDAALRTSASEAVDARPPMAAELDEEPMPTASASGATFDDQPIAYVSLGLTVGDGFKFGCGLALATLIALLAVALVVSLILLAAGFAGLPVPLTAQAFP